MKGSEVHNMKDDELVAKLIDAKQQSFNLRFRHATGELENTARLGQAKQDIARLLTVAKERGIDVEGLERLEALDGRECGIGWGRLVARDEQRYPCADQHDDRREEEREQDERDHTEHLAGEQHDPPRLSNQELAQRAEAVLARDLGRCYTERHDAEQHGGPGDADDQAVRLGELVQRHYPAVRRGL